MTLIALLGIFILWICIGMIDFSLVHNYKKPFFCVGVDLAEDGGSGMYRGLGYSFDIEGNFMPESTDAGVTSYRGYLFGKEVCRGFWEKMLLVRVLCCILAVIFVLIATIIWKTKDVGGKRIKIGIMIVLFAIIIIGGIIDSKKIRHADAEYGYQFAEDVNTQYFFTGKVVAVYEECLILEVFDIGNSNLYEGCQVEVSTDVVSVKGCPNFVVNEFARVLMARNTEENPAKRLHALAIYKTDETGSILYNNND